jgi:hypothetical protein
MTRQCADMNELQGAERGTTLLELLVYLALASLVLLMASEGLQLTRSLAARTVATAGRGSALEIGFQRLRDALAGPSEADDAPAAFVGTPSEITLGTTGAVRTLRTVIGPDGVRLEQVSSDGATTVLADRANAVAFAFRSLHPRDTGWLNRWSNADFRPELLRITVRPAAPDVPIETVLPLEPRIDRDCLEGGNCSPDPERRAP